MCFSSVDTRCARRQFLTARSFNTPDPFSNLSQKHTLSSSHRSGLPTLNPVPKSHSLPATCLVTDLKPFPSYSNSNTRFDTFAGLSSPCGLEPATLPQLAEKCSQPSCTSSVAILTTGPSVTTELTAPTYVTAHGLSPLRLSPLVDCHRFKVPSAVTTRYILTAKLF